ncbi:hypothetical protein [Sphingomonas sp. LHG3406-1]|uniref:hypothetical protein n=1 Tax=Sphingomonas sp. LHG3406-1 TaxID=2804617 RepID=UPI002627D9C7|nr:hypothetical protein [Sphingomonas sp. LHG3406-1]
MRTAILVLLAASAAACSGNEKVADNAVMPALDVASETPGDWSGLVEMVGRRPSESGLIESSAISVDLNALLGPDAGAFRDAMMRAGPLARDGDLLVARAPDAWLVLDPADHAFRAALRQGGSVREWQTPGAEVPPAGG